MIEHDHPLAGISPFGLKAHDATTEFGRALRKADAHEQLLRFDLQRLEHEAELQRLAEIDNRLVQERERARLSVQHMLQFGVSFNEREVYQDILREVGQHGGFSLKEAAQLAHVKLESEWESIR